MRKRIAVLKSGSSGKRNPEECSIVRRSAGKMKAITNAMLILSRVSKFCLKVFSRIKAELIPKRRKAMKRNIVPFGISSQRELSNDASKK